MESRITELEVKLSHCEDHLDELNRTVFRQQQQLELLQAQVRELYRLTQHDGGAERPGDSTEIPPHY